MSGRHMPRVPQARGGTCRVRRKLGAGHAAHAAISGWRAPFVLQVRRCTWRTCHNFGAASGARSVTLSIHPTRPGNQHVDAMRKRHETKCHVNQHLIYVALCSMPLRIRVPTNQTAVAITIINTFATVRGP